MEEFHQVFDIRSRVSASVIDIFDTMLSFDVALADDESMDDNASRISGSIGFAGDIVGVLRFEVSSAFSEIMTAEMLGMEVDELEGDDEVKDLLLEFTNMMAGNLKSAFNDHGLPCVISTPSITSGSDFDIQILNMARYERLDFQCDNMGEHHILVEVCVKSPDETLSEVMQKLTTVDISKFKRLDIISTAGDTLVELFDLMLSMKLETCEAEDETEYKGDRIVGSVNFAGEVVGVLSVIAEKNFARIITGKMIDRPLEEIQDEEEVKDAMGEISNIVAGNLKSGFVDSNLFCEISLPSITAGNDFKIEVLNMARYERFSFQFYEHQLFVEVCVKIDESVKVSDSVPAEAERLVEETPKAPEPVPDDVSEPDGTSEAQEEYEFPDISHVDETPSTPERKETGIADPKTPRNIDFILDIPVELSVELGKTRMKLQDVRELLPGKSVVFDNIEDEKLEIYANNQLIARGEVVVEKGKYGIRITEVVSRLERIKKLK